MRIGVVVDHPKRDLAGCVRVAYELVRRGHEALLLPHYEQGIEAPLLGLDGVVLNNARPHYRALAEGYRAAGTAIFILDTEGGVLGEDGFNAPSRIAQRFRESGIGRLVDGYLFWGERLWSAFAEHSGLAPEQLQITGCPRYDICHPLWRKTLSYPRRGFFLINTNFNAVNPLLASGRNSDRQALRSQGVQDSEIESRYRAARLVFDNLIPEMQRLAKRGPERRFVLRPHPFERVEYYRQAFSGCDNVTIDDSGDVMAVLSAAKGMLHVNCGTSVEATFLGVLPISIEYSNNDAARLLNPLPARISRQVHSSDELEDVLEHVAEMSASHPFDAIYREHIRPWFYENDGLAGARVAEAISRWLSDHSVHGRRSIRLSLISGQKPPRLSQVTQGVISQLLGSRVTRAMREALDPGRRHKRFALSEVQQLLKKFDLADASPFGTIAAALHNPYTGHQLLTVAVNQKN